MHTHRRPLLATLLAGVIALAGLILPGGLSGSISASAAGYSVYADTIRYYYNTDDTITIFGWEPRNLATGELTTSLDIPAQIDGTPVTSIQNMAFYNAVHVAQVTLPDTITQIGDYAFLGCTSLTELVLPKGLTTAGSYAFSGCTALTTLTLPASLEQIDQTAFVDCAGLTAIQVAEENAAYSSLDGVLLDRDQTRILCYPAAKTGDYTVPQGVTTIDTGAFRDNTSLAQLTLPEGVVTIGSYAFSNCTALSTVALPVSVTAIGNFAFSGCDSLTRVDYAGTAAQWDDISINYNYNESLANAAIHVVAEPEEPEEDPDSTDPDPDNTQDPTPSVPTLARGDLDGDGSVTIQDAYQALVAYANASAGLADGLNSAQRIAADVDDSGQIDIQDAYRILAYYAAASAGITPIWT